jgi:glycosyltransferase involved in cell wall biosynthesis
MNTTVHYWYLIPILALGVVWKSRALVGLSLLFVPYFEVLERFSFEGVFVGAWWQPVATYVPFLALFWLEMSGRWPVRGSGRASVGVVVPVLNDAGPLGRLLESLEGTGIPRDRVVVADGGSGDGSREVVERWGARLVDCPRPGRGGQVALGAAQLDTELVLILHADTRVPRNVISAIRRAAAAYPEAPGGAFRLRYETTGVRMRVVSVASNVKTALFGLSFGDQGQWFRPDRVEVPAIPLMEDVEMAVRMNDAGRPVWTSATVEVSTRRYERQGALRVVCSVVARVVGYLAHRRWTGEVPDTTDLYEDYYRSPKGKGERRKG